MDGVQWGQAMNHHQFPVSSRTLLSRVLTPFTVVTNNKYCVILLMGCCIKQTSWAEHHTQALSETVHEEVAKGNVTSGGRSVK